MKIPMADKIVFNDSEEYHIGEEGLPCLITYAEKTGGSHFTVTLVTDLFLRGSKILFLTAYPMAKDDFLQQIQGSETKTAYVTNTDQLNTNAQAIILESGNEELFLNAIKQLDDVHNRVVLIKNIEVFSSAVFDTCESFQKVILSGNIDQCIAREQISEKKFKTIVMFTRPVTPLPVEPPTLEKYVGYLWSNGQKGLVTTRVEH